MQITTDQWRTQEKISGGFKVLAGLVGSPGAEPPGRRRIFENLQKNFLIIIKVQANPDSSITLKCLSIHKLCLPCLRSNRCTNSASILIGQNVLSSRLKEDRRQDVQIQRRVNRSTKCIVNFIDTENLFKINSSFLLFSFTNF